MATLVFIDEVLRSQTGAPIPQGIALFRTLKERERVLILSKDKARDDVWLKAHKINFVDDLIGLESVTFTDFPEWRLVEYCRGQWHIDMVITSNPELATKLLTVGITTLMFLHPVYITERFRPDSRTGVRAWESISKEIATQQEAFIDDHRLNRDI